MKIAVIGGPGIVGSGIVNLLQQNHEVISIGKSRGDIQLDVLDAAAVEAFFQSNKDLDGVISTTGNGNVSPVSQLTRKDLDWAIESKLIANFNLVQAGINNLSKGGFITITSGTASHTPVPGASSISMACAGIEGFVRSMKVENTNGIRINAVSPYYVKETMELFGMDSSHGISSADTAKAFESLIDSNAHATIIDVKSYLNL